MVGRLGKNGLIELAWQTTGLASAGATGAGFYVAAIN